MIIHRFHLRTLLAFGLACLMLATVSPALGVDATETPMAIQKLDHQTAGIKIDGKLDESTWQQVNWYNNMVVVEPDTLVDSPWDTRVRMFYTPEGLYLGVWCKQDPETLVSRLSSRDRFISRDDVSFTLDPSGTGLYGYWFAVNLGGSLVDGTVLPERQFSNQWDGPWKGAAAELEDGWSAEMFLPWSMMTMPEADGGNREMGFYVSRRIAHKDERVGWPALPRTKGVFMSQLQKISLEGISPKQQFTFYPFAAATYNRVAAHDSYKAGFDVFWRPTSNLQLTATVNPDFGNVESDDIDVNLTSFETFFPEKD